MNSDRLLLPSAPQAEHAVSRIGKRVSTMPVVRHGLGSTDRVFLSTLDRVDRNQFARLRCDVFRELQPEGTLEKMLVEHVVVAHFRLLRLYAIDNAVAGRVFRRLAQTGQLDLGAFDMKRLQAIAQYERQIERTLRLSLHKWEQMKAARLLDSLAALGGAKEEVFKAGSEHHPGLPSQNMGGGVTNHD